MARLNFDDVTVAVDGNIVLHNITSSKEACRSRVPGLTTSSSCAWTNLWCSTALRVDRLVRSADPVSCSEGDGGQRLRAGKLQSPRLQPSPRR